MRKTANGDLTTVAVASFPLLMLEDYKKQNSFEMMRSSATKNESKRLPFNNEKLAAEAVRNNDNEELEEIVAAVQYPKEKKSTQIRERTPSITS